MTEAVNTTTNNNSSSVSNTTVTDMSTPTGTTVSDNASNVLLIQEAINMIKETVNASETLEQSRYSPSFFTRVRKLPFIIVIYIMLCLSKRKISTQLQDYFKDDFIRNGYVEKMKLSDYMQSVASQQAYSQARAKFNHMPFKLSFDKLRDYEYGQNTFGLNLFFNHLLAAIDGSEIPLPDKAYLGEHFGCNGRNSDSPVARASIAYDPLNMRTIAAEFEPMDVDERTMAIRHIDELSNVLKGVTPCFIFDRGYMSAALLTHLNSTPAKYVFRLRSKYNVEIDNLPLGDHRIKLNGANKEEIELRILKFTIDSPTEGTVVETLATNWFDLPSSEFKELYHLRWPVETNYSLLKNKLQLTDFTGLSVNSIIQEFWLAVLMSYLVGITFFEAQAVIDANASCDNSNKYQPNVNGIVGTLKCYIKDILLCNDKATLADLGMCIVNTAARDRVVKSTTDRHFARKTPRKARNHCNLKRNI
ncbi:MAG: IS4 family transposase [Clostridia bacterium]|nr:IS4 family transposase [Clostridia bacterium]